MGGVWGEEWHVEVSGRVSLIWDGLRLGSMVEKMEKMEKMSECKVVILVLRAARRLRDEESENGLGKLQLEWEQVLELNTSRRTTD